MCRGVYTRGIVQVSVCIYAQSLGGCLGFVVWFVELHAVFLGTLGRPWIFGCIAVCLFPLACENLQHHLLQRRWQGKVVGICLHLCLGVSAVLCLEFRARLVCKQGVQCLLVLCHRLRTDSNLLH